MKYILIALTLFACNTVAKKNAARKISTEVLDTINTVPAKITAAPFLFETAFIKGTTQPGKITPINLYGVTIGKLKIVSGQIVACDPLHIDEYGIPFTQIFPTGEFPVQLSIAQTGEGDLVAFARIKFSDEPVEKWELALQKGQEPLAVDDEEIHGYGVDGGVGVFIDKETIKTLNLDASGDIDPELHKAMEKHYHNTWRYTMFGTGKHNLACFTTGLGDGKYATYIGFDAAGKPCRLLSDFHLFDWKKK